MKKAGPLASALSRSGAIVAAAAAPDPSTRVQEPAAPPPQFVARPKPQPSREGTAPITVHLPKVVRRQLKTLAAEQERKVEAMVSEALNLLFAKYRKAEIAPRS
jgi:hypothetical protein